jgi:hypothetical protein
MKVVVPTLVALLALAAVATPTNALDAKSFWEQQGRESGGSSN